MKPSRKKWVTFGWLFLINTVASIGLSFVFYWLFGKEIRLHGGPLEIDFFNTVCGIFTIIGLAVAIFQLTDIKTEKQIAEETRIRIHTASFKRDFTGIMQGAVGSILELEELIEFGDVNEVALRTFLAKIDVILDEFHKMEVQQIVIQCGAIVDCKKCLSLLSQLSVDFREIIDNNAYQSFPKNHYIGVVKDLRKEGDKCEAEMLKL